MNALGLSAESFGVMQGRLSRQTPRGYQAFPKETWIEEFRTAKDYGFQHIEWVLDSSCLDDNPLMSNVSSVSRVIEETEVNVKSVCADFLMDTPLGSDGELAWTRTTRLFQAMHELGALHVVIPCVDQSSLLVASNLARLKGSVARLGDLAKKFDINISMETDLPPLQFAKLLDSLPRDRFFVNYDIGNSASLGYSFVEEFEAYFNRISIVHIKDRHFGGGSVLLGDGDAAVIEILKGLNSRGFSGLYTMQAFRDHEGTSVLREQLAWLNQKLGSVS